MCCSEAVCELEAVSLGLKSSNVQCNYVAGSSQKLLVLVKNSPGKRDVVPYTSSTVVHCKSSFNVVWMPNGTNGKLSVHFTEFGTTLQGSFELAVKSFYQTIGNRIAFGPK